MKCAEPPAPEPIDVCILMGKTGVGKSSLIRLLGGKDQADKEPAVNDGIDSCTQHATMYTAQVSGQNVCLLDTPGFDDSVMDNLKVLDEIISHFYFCALRRDTINIRGVIFLHDISETRMSSSQKKTWEILRAFCGSPLMSSVIVGTTMWSVESKKKFKKEEEREKSFLERFWSETGGTIRLADDDRDAAGQIVTDLLAKPPCLLQVQLELLRPPHTAEETTVGRIAMPEGRAERARLQKQLEEQTRELREEASRHKEALEREREEIRRQLDEATRNKEERQRLEDKYKEQLERQREFEETMRQREEEMTSELKRMSNELERQLKQFRKIPVISFISESISSCWTWVRGGKVDT
ncbi:hypothetical protein BDD12DRAFT_853207 [Trichophaea hybrida]|nr:hypothetical protein BDD12DRAFT_853207 [Trichophaea hybrida]